MGRYQDALDYIFSFVNYEKPVRFGYNAETLNLGRMRELLDRLGRPQDCFRCVHIAGTKGKGSTSAMIESVLRTAGYRTGLYTSPHMHTWRERIRFDGTLMPKAALVEQLGKARPSIEAMPELTAFERGGPGDPRPGSPRSGPGEGADPRADRRHAPVARRCAARCSVCVGPPGVGKTSLGRSVARALNRQIRADVAGGRARRGGDPRPPPHLHRRRCRAGSCRPCGGPARSIRSSSWTRWTSSGVDYRGDPAAALLEVLDPEQNHAFNDHYLEVDYDLSRVLFLTTANSAGGDPAGTARPHGGDPPAGLPREREAGDRREVPPAPAARGLRPEAGRSLRRPSGDVAGHSRVHPRGRGAQPRARDSPGSAGGRPARKATDADSPARVEIGVKDIEAFLGVPRFLPEEVERRDRIGLATGLAWSEAGGSVLQIEVGVLPGRGKLILTGKLGADHAGVGPGRPLLRALPGGAARGSIRMFHRGGRHPRSHPRGGDPEGRAVRGMRPSAWPWSRR